MVSPHTLHSTQTTQTYTHMGSPLIKTRPFCGRVICAPRIHPVPRQPPAALPSANMTRWTGIICQTREITPQHGRDMIQSNWTLRLDEHEHLPCIHHVFASRLKDKSDRELNRIQQRGVHDMTCHQQNRVGQSSRFFQSQVLAGLRVPARPGESDSLARGSGQLPIAAWGGRGNCCRPPCVCRCP